MNLKLSGLKKTQSAGILFLVGLLFGIIFANMLRKYYINDLRLLNFTYNSILEENTLDYVGLFKYTLLNNLKEFAIFWLLCFTILGIPCVIFAIAYKGLEIGFMISALTILYGTKGIILFFSSIMPQAFIYVPLIIISFQKGYELSQQTYFRSKNHAEGRKPLWMNYIALILLLLVLLGIGSILETYFGSGLLARTLKLCI